MANDQTHRLTIEADVRKIANRSDLTEANLEFFLKAKFVGDMADYVQEKESAAYQRGMAAAKQPTIRR